MLIIDTPYNLSKTQRKILALMICVLFGLMAHVPVWAYHKWYDEKGFVHYTEADPPFNAKNEDGSSWWGEEPDSQDSDLNRKKRIVQTRQKKKTAMHLNKARVANH